jgi:hypothetical protein|uniref:Uncharacterized protein n=1 Tax=Bacteriophage sp. TaxID=38018 RepID=A0A7G9A3S2_9VIRU|nr:MAG: hypothetical protein [Bacteriophage sp.]
MKAEDFDRKFDDGENIIEYLDLTKIKRSNVVSHQPKILFSEEVNIKSQEKSTWKPCVIIDKSRLEDDN